MTNSLRGFRALSVVVFAGAFLMTPMPAKAQPSSHVPYVPPGNADSPAPVQAIWTQVWSYKGLATTVELLKAIHHPRYKEFEKVQAKFKAAFGEAYEKKIAERPTWTIRG